MTSYRKRWLAAAVLGCAAIAVALWFASRVVPDCGVPVAAPMLTFELALDHDELAKVIDCLPRRTELDRQNTIDLMFFIPAYSAFLAAFAWAAGVRPNRALVVGAGIALSDYVETLALRAISAAWPYPEPLLLPALAVGARVKFVLIGLIMLFGAAAVWRHRRGLARPLAAVMMVGSLGSILSMVPGIGRVGSIMIALAWLMMLAYAAARTLRAGEQAQAH